MSPDETKGHRDAELLQKRESDVEDTHTPVILNQSGRSSTSMFLMIREGDRSGEDVSVCVSPTETSAGKMKYTFLVLIT